MWGVLLCVLALSGAASSGKNSSETAEEKLKIARGKLLTVAVKKMNADEISDLLDSLGFYKRSKKGEENLRLGLAYASGSVFTHNRTFDDGDAQGDKRKVETEIVSHLPLQMLLYFNVFFFPFWWMSEVVMLELKFGILPGHYQGVLVTGMILITGFEGLRLYLGYVGNLKEKVPELAGFWLLTFLFQLPVLLFFLTDEGIIILPLERAVHSIYLIFLLSELLAALLALRVMSRKLTLQFHVRQFREVQCVQPTDTSPPDTYLPYRRSVFPMPSAKVIHV